MFRKLFLNTILLAVLAASTAAYAQTYGGMGAPGGTSPSSTPTYTQKSYGVNKAAMGAALGGGIVGGALLVRHFRHRNMMTACVGSDGKTLSDGKEVYSARGESLIPNERLVVAGKKVKSDKGEPAIEVTQVRKDLGRCEVPALSASK